MFLALESPLNKLTELDNLPPPSLLLFPSLLQIYLEIDLLIELDTDIETNDDLTLLLFSSD